MTTIRRILKPDDMELVTVGISDVTPHPDNPRKHTTRRQVEGSVDSHGQFKPILVQKSTGYILAGNGTWQVFHDRGTDELAVVMIDVDDAQAVEIMLADNATGEHSSYDTDVLARLLEGAEAQAVGFTQQAVEDYTRLMNEALSMDDLEEKYGNEPEPNAFYPVVRLPLPHDLYDPWIRLVAEHHDGDAVAAFRWVLNEAGVV